MRASKPILLMAVFALGCSKKDTALPKVETASVETTSPPETKPQPGQADNSKTRPVPAPAAPDVAEPSSTDDENETPAASDETKEVPRETPESNTSPKKKLQEGLHPSCAALMLDPDEHRRWLREAIKKARKRNTKKATAYLDGFSKLVEAAGETGHRALLSKILPESDSNAALDLRLWPPEGTKEDERTTIWARNVTANRPERGARGCWAIVRTGVIDVKNSDYEDTIIVRYRYAIAFANDSGGVSKIDIPIFSDGIDAYNLLTVQDLDRDGWEEAFYDGSNGWEGQLHDPVGGRRVLSLTAKGGVLRKTKPLRLNGWSKRLSEFKDVNGDGRVDIVLAFSYYRPEPCNRGYGDEIGGGLWVAAISDESGRFRFDHPDNIAFLKEQCGDYQASFDGITPVLCARVFGECISAIQERIRLKNSRWCCDLESAGKKQLKENANRAYTAMMGAARFVPFFTVHRICNR